MRKPFSKLLLVLFLSATMVVSFAVSAWCAEKVIIKMASEYNDKHPTVKNGWFPWIEELKKKTDGQLVIQFYNPNTLVPAKEVYNAVTAGSVDLGATAQWLAYGKFPLADVVSLPMMFNGAEAGSLTIWDLYQTFPEWREEYKDVKILWQWTSATLQFHTKKKEIKTLEDLQGMKIIGWGANGLRMIKALGANPIEVTPHDTYLALERGMADGVLCPLAPMKAFKITDAAKFHTIVDAYCDSFWAGMNWNKWNSLPQEFKKLLTDTTGRKMAEISGKTLDEGAIADAKWMKEQGHKFYVLPKAEKKRWKEKVNFIAEDWIKSVEDKGYKNARKIYEETVKLADKYSGETVGGYTE
jgi:TRAP-type C4-dicarboxylate transport system substrate-binding protein